jgi:uncharacterized protein (DUF952 family)
MSDFVYKIVETVEWQKAETNGSYAGSADDRRDGFIHLSTSSQLAGTLARHFAGRDGLVLVAIEAAKLAGKLKWEPARNGELFPHFYGALPVGAACWVRPLPRGAHGCHEIGKDVT